MLNLQDRTADAVAAESWRQLREEVPRRPILVVGERGTGRGSLLERTAQVLEARGDGNHSRLGIVNLRAEKNGTLQVVPSAVPNHAEIVGAAGRWLQFLSAALASGVPAAGSAAPALTVGAAFIGIAGTGLAVAEGELRGRSPSTSSDTPTVTPLGALAAAVHNMPKDDLHGLVFVVHEAHRVNPSRFALLADHLQVLRAVASVPVALIAASTPTGANALDAALLGIECARFSAPILDSFDVLALWPESNLQFANEVVQFTSGRAGLVLELKRVSQTSRSGLNNRPGKPGTLLAWTLGQLQEVIQASLADSGVTDALRVAQCSRLLVQAARAGGIVAAATIEKLSLDGDLASDLRGLCRPEGTGSSGWRILEFIDDIGAFKLTEMAKSAYLLLGDASPTIAAVVAPTDRSAHDNFEQTFLEEWVASAVNEPLLLNPEAASFAVRTGRTDLAARMRRAAGEFERERAFQEAQAQATVLKATMSKADAKYLLTSGQHLYYLTKALPPDEALIVLPTCVDALRIASASDPRAIEPLIRALLRLAEKHSPFYLSPELAGLLSQYETDSRRDAFLLSCRSLIATRPMLALRAALHGTVESLTHTRGSLGSAAEGLWCILEVLDHGNLNEADELSRAVHQMHNDVGCAISSENPFLSAEAFLREAFSDLAQRRAGAPEFATKALVRAWEIDGIAYEALSYIVATLSMEEEPQRLLILGYGTCLLAIAERSSPYQEAAWWALMAQNESKAGNDKSSSPLLGMACALTHALGAFEMPPLLEDILEERFLPRPAPVAVTLGGITHRLTAADKDWILLTSTRLTRSRAVENTKSAVVDSVREEGSVEPCEEHPPEVVSAELATLLSRIADFCGTTPFSPQHRNLVLAELSDLASPLIY